MILPTTRRGRFWVALGSPKAVRTIWIAVLVYALIIGGLMLGYTNVQQCLSDYSDQNAEVLRVRAKTTVDDRLLQQRVDAVDQADRVRIIANQAALADLVKAAGRNDARAAEAALVEFTKVNDTSLDTFAKNEKERSSIASERARIDAIRAATPIPGPPSEEC